MKTLKEQIESKCKHFTGLANKECAVGIKYEDVKVKNSRPYKFPCAKDNDFAGGTCAKVCWKTPEEVKDEMEELEEAVIKEIKAYMAVKNCSIPHVNDTVCDDEVNPYLLTGEELERTVQASKSRY